MAKRGSFPCPNCGEVVPAGAKVCPECGSDETTGWSDNTVYDGAGIPNPEEIDYDKVLEQEGLAKSKRSPGRMILLVVTAVLILVIILLFMRR